MIKFVDEKGTVFIYGPFQIKNKKYDFMFCEEGIIDFCSEQQLNDWNIEKVKEAEILYSPRLKEFIIEGRTIKEEALTKEEFEELKKKATVTDFFVEITNYPDVKLDNIIKS